jgi:hypothetical protein
MGDNFSTPFAFEVGDAVLLEIALIFVVELVPVLEIAGGLVWLLLDVEVFDETGADAATETLAVVAPV